MGIAHAASLEDHRRAGAQIVRVVRSARTILSATKMSRPTFDSAHLIDCKNAETAVLSEDIDRVTAQFGYSTAFGRIAYEHFG
jgi:hypothetical protein